MPTRKVLPEAAGSGLCTDGHRDQRLAFLVSVPSEDGLHIRSHFRRLPYPVWFCYGRSEKSFENNDLRIIEFF
ncbi:hypothetical protein [Comamonas testosteroni]|uniref:hypothetical protein n=1 Tax=Comamonas testosteroni TaxID=285 RepID=UPI0025ECFEF0|nr:hypothetical protein [Comamonas testosteroni]MEB5966348.1 hypothetical protein [Comamonas testosteroni]